jgi:cytochrome b6-f complex iron-sulfur subunit
VYYSAAHRRLECPCHEGYFSVTSGRVLQGPPPRPLPRIQLERRGSEIFATGVVLEPQEETT